MRSFSLWISQKTQAYMKQDITSPPLSPSSHVFPSSVIICPPFSFYYCSLRCLLCCSTFLPFPSVSITPHSLCLPRGGWSGREAKLAVTCHLRGHTETCHHVLYSPFSSGPFCEPRRVVRGGEEGLDLEGVAVWDDSWECFQEGPAQKGSGLMWQKWVRHESTGEQMWQFYRRKIKMMMRWWEMRETYCRGSWVLCNLK